MEMLDKPAYGQPCNGCGRCCQQELCPVGEKVFGFFRGPCPAIEPDGDAMRCGLMAHPRRYAPTRAALYGAAELSAAAATLNGAGYGCDMEGDDDTETDFERQRMRDAIESIPVATKLRARKVWGV